MVPGQNFMLKGRERRFGSRVALRVETRQGKPVRSTPILARLVTGCSWDVAARLTPAGETTLRNRRTEWLKAGVFNKLVEESIAGYDKIIGLDLSEVAVDGSLHKAPCGGEGTGPNPTDRAKIGWKWSVATDLFGIPIGWVIDGANRNDSILLTPTLQADSNRGLLHWTAATTAPSPRRAARPSDSPTSSAPRRNAKVKPRSRSHSPWACDGPSNPPTPGYPASANSAATPTGSACNASARSPSPSPSS